MSLPSGSVVGTSSVRRASQLKYRRADLQILPLRGNVDTRIRKLKEDSANEKMDGIVIALAGVRRSGLEDQVTEILPLDVMLPAIGQGAIALLIRKQDDQIKEVVSKIDDPRTHIEIDVERTFLEKLGGGCHVPIAGLAQLDDAGGVVTLQGGIFSTDGRHCLKATLSAPKVEAIHMAERLAQMLLSQGGSKLLQ
jgi:hydroxymethylbilane synthase